MRRAAIATALLALAAGGGAVLLHGRAAATTSPLVHGQWTIDVRDRGRLVGHHDFHNDLMPIAKSLFAKLLAGSVALPAWSVRLDAASPGSSPCGSYCRIGVAGANVPATAPTLGVASSGNALVLTGEFDATQAGTVDAVASIFTNAYFTSRTGLNIKVAKGQQVQVKVNLTFQ